MKERRICIQPVMREYVTRGEIQDSVTGEWNTARVKRMGVSACGSEKWTNETETSYLVPSGPGAGNSVIRSYKQRTDRPVCENGHIMGSQD